MTRFVTPLLIFCALLFPALELRAQAQRDPQALLLAKLSVQALVGNTRISDATLQGTANFTAGSDEESGTFALEVKGNQESKIVLNMSGGARTEIRNAQNGPQGEWVGTDGQKHAMALHNCWVDASTFFPAFSLGAALNNAQIAAIYLGQGSFGGVTVDHLQFSVMLAPPGQNINVEIQALSRLDVYLDAASHLPVALAFNIHPDSDMGLNIPVQVQFSGYQQTGGINVATRIQKLVQGTLTFDFTVASVGTNSGIPDSEFNTD